MVSYALSKYQKKYGETKDVDAAIASIGAKLREGQKLYRGDLTLSGIQLDVLSLGCFIQIGISVG